MCWGGLGPVAGLFGEVWGVFEAFWGTLGPFLGGSWSHFGEVEAHLREFGTFCGVWGVLGGLIWDPMGVRVGEKGSGCCGEKDPAAVSCFLPGVFV